MVSARASLRFILWLNLLVTKSALRQIIIRHSGNSWYEKGPALQLDICPCNQG
jgi:hypothetical protein